MKNVWTELNRAIHKEFIDTKFEDFGQGLLTAIFKLWNIVKCYGNNWKRS